MSAIGTLDPVRGGGEATPALFRPLSAEDEEQLPAEIESLCMACHSNGVTRLLLTRIPFFKEIIVSSFACSRCGSTNSEIQSAGRIQDQGVCYMLTVRSKQDMNREVVKTDCATARVPELDFEIPAFSQKGVLTTIEGLIERAIEGLKQDQPFRRETHPDVAEKIEEFICKLKRLKDVDSAFTFILDDPSGNSFVENPHAPQRDEALVVTHYRRTAQQAALLGIEAEESKEDLTDSVDDLRNEVLQFGTNCPECNAPASTNMKLVQIPHFKEVIIMATNCDACGHRTNEVKSGGAIEPLGTKITLHVTDPSDMTRDILKVAKNPFTLGDSSTSDRAEKLCAFGRKLQQVVDGQLRIHFVLDDPAGNSYLQNVYAPEEDPEMRVEHYERRFEQNEELGLNDMKTEGYEAEGSSQR
ncbi:zinc finger protein ZPR1 isoform X2 [Podarcis raffonei]|uniref:zinc finger protein ZPR1 isoform X2 n=1 Tax=Podarcis raffonei TaxID=65483 RepID=UPI00232925F0|nr:zinc finger protein ZPR1 isoform X2 [Podarcis raffonei]